MGLQVSILTSPTGAMLLDPTPYMSGLAFGTNKHGFGACSLFAPRTLIDSFYVYDRPGLPHVVVTWNGQTLYEGRLEDVAVVGSGLRLTAFGYWRSLSDVPYTALWSLTTTESAFSPNGDNNTAYSQAERFSTDNQDRLFVGLVKNNAYSLNKAAGWLFTQPDGGRKQIATISMDYSFTASTNCSFRVVSFDWSSDTAFGSGTAENTIVGNGASQTGSLDITLASDKDLAGIDLIASTAHTYAGETAAEFLSVTNVRVKTTTESTVRAGLIAADMLNAVTTLNSNQIQSSVAAINNTAFDLHDELFEDAYIPDALDRLALLGDGVDVWEVGVFEGRLLHLRERGSLGRHWYVDVSGIEVDRTIEILRNNAYATYTMPSRRVMRTATSDDDFSIARYGLTRQGFIATKTTSTTEAGSHRDLFLDDNKDPKPRAALVFKELYDSGGARWPVFVARSGDTITIRNLPPTLSTDIDRIRTFLIAETEYDADADAISVTPEVPLPTLDVLIARNSAGVKG